MAEIQALAPYGPTVILLFLVLGFVLKFAPTWKEVRLKELELRREELAVRDKESMALGSLSVGLSNLSEVLQSIAVEQRRATETIEILQRVNADASDKLTTHVQSLAQRLDKVEELNINEFRKTALEMGGRLDSLEKHVGPQSATARA
ncbi:MAG: hypothetical protein ACRD9R_10835 [Pyrinomonadaceae bacterium]